MEAVAEKDANAVSCSYDVETSEEPCAPKGNHRWRTGKHACADPRHLFLYCTVIAAAVRGIIMTESCSVMRAAGM
jgi:hypothetical protein